MANIYNELLKTDYLEKLQNEVIEVNNEDVKERKYPTVTTEQQNAEVEAYERKQKEEAVQLVSEKQKANMKIWEAVLKDEDGNEVIGPKNHKVAYDENGVKFIPPFLHCKEDDKGNKKYYIKKGYVAEYLIENINSIHIAGVLHLYENGVYRPIFNKEEEGIIKALITPEFSTQAMTKDIAYQWKIDHRINVHQKNVNPNPFLINLKNGMLDISDLDNWKFTEGHSPDYLSTIQVQANYNKNAKGENFKKFLNSSVPDKQVQMLLQEMIGYCLTPFTHSKQMLFILTGEGDSGKSTFINSTLESLLDDTAKANQELQELDNEYNRAELFEKIVNVYSELPDKPLKDSGYLKAATGNDSLPARRIYEAPFKFKNKAKFVFSANTLPANFSSDTSDAYYNRLTIVPFIGDLKKKDPTLKYKLEKELDFILMWALEGLHRLMKNGWKFTQNDKSEDLKAEYKKESNPIMTFIEDYCELDPSNETPRANLFIAWQNFCQQNGHHAGSQIKFNKNLKTLYGNKVTQSQMNNSKRTKSWKGIRELKFDEIE
ncbi:hypothetical protein GLW08_12630 [Pontibacillus yanchengensis]|uniref:Uncharacterized protein n=1 Tax=Pontibacillus yanchengensis TaxID=462910 RepID=A0ACC7VHC0_9BACI|nr:phage/plasmid primase, P4 family [Pontibacillus yanchengensis]MYL54183.1 hypothetical protein [Pontibacillus yanchengensis]